VRFLLFPCNQFKNQEPNSNGKIKKFAEQYIDLEKGNMVMFAKSNLNHVQCTFDGADACTPVSSMCCPRNDAIYDYLLSYPLKCSTCAEKTTKDAPIGWNFNKIFVDEHGYPWSDEILPAEAWDLVPYIDALLAHANPTLFASSGSAPRISPTPNAYLGLGGFCLVCVVFISIAVASRIKGRRNHAEDVDACYIRVA